MFQSHLSHFLEESIAIASEEDCQLSKAMLCFCWCYYLLQLLKNKNEIFQSLFLNLSKSIYNCLQSKVVGIGINEEPLEYKEIRSYNDFV